MERSCKQYAFFTCGDRGSPHWEGIVQMTDDVGVAEKNGMELLW